MKGYALSGSSVKRSATVRPLVPPPTMTKSYENSKSVSRPITLAFFAIGDAKVAIKKTRRNERRESISTPDLSEKEKKGDIIPHCRALEGTR